MLKACLNLHIRRINYSKICYHIYKQSAFSYVVLYEKKINYMKFNFKKNMMVFLFLLKLFSKYWILGLTKQFKDY